MATSIGGGFFSRIFRWRSRVKTGTPELAGNSVETLTSHVSDTNAHPDYLKKGTAVPTGQEAFMLAKHTSSKVAHAPYETRRDELLKTLAQYEQAKDQDLVDVANNYYKGVPMRHVLTAFVLDQILAGYVDVDMFKNVVKRHYDEEGHLNAVGDGSQLIYIENNSDGFGYAMLSTKSIGSQTKPVYVVGGVVKEVPYECVLAGGNVDQNITGVKTFVKIPKISNANTLPSADVDFVTVAYLKKYAQIPVGGVYTHIFKTGRVTSGSTTTEPVAYSESEIAAKLGYGTWAKLAYAGDYACMYVRQS